LALGVLASFVLDQMAASQKSEVRSRKPDPGHNHYLHRETVLGKQLVTSQGSDSKCCVSF